MLAILRPESALAMAEQDQFIWRLSPNWKRVAAFIVAMKNHSVLHPERGDFFEFIRSLVKVLDELLRDLTWKFKYGF